MEQLDFEDENEERRKKVKDNKRHFKKLMTLFLVGDQREKKEIKQILNRCNYINKKGRSHTDASDMDKFAQIV